MRPCGRVGQMDTRAESAPAVGSGRGVLGSRRQWSESALARQEEHLATARAAVAELERLRAEMLADHGEAGRAPGVSTSADELTVRVAELTRQLVALEESAATARSQALGLRRIEDRAGERLPFRAGPLPGAPFAAGTDAGEPADRRA